MTVSLYSLVSRLSSSLSWIPGKLGDGIAGRRRAADCWETWAREHRAAGPVLWIHAASVGEALMMEPVVTRLRVAVPDLQVVLSHSSPSLTGWRIPYAAYTDYAPLDLHRPATRFLDAVRPTALAIARRELWPTLMALAVDRMPVSIVGGRARPTRGLSGLYGAILSRVSWIGAITDGDADAWRHLGAPDDRVEVTGDPAHDRVLDQIPDLTTVHGLRSWTAEKAVLVAGSVERSDENALLGAAARVLQSGDPSGLLVIPHDPTPEAVRRWVERAEHAGLATATWRRGAQVQGQPQVVVVAETGLLADLYALGKIAYVGGGFRRRRLHSVAEPAAYGLPILCGPHIGPQREAGLLRTKSGLHTVTASDADLELATHWRRYLQNGDHRAADGLAARSVLQGGAASRSAEILASQIVGEGNAG